MIIDDVTSNALIEVLMKSGGTFAGAIAALGVVWRYAISPLATRLLDMHDKLSNNVISAMHDHARALEKIGSRIERIETLVAKP